MQKYFLKNVLLSIIIYFFVGISYSASVESEIFKSWEDEYNKNSELFKSSGLMKEYAHNVLNKNLKQAVQEGDKKKRDFYFSYINKINNTQDSTIQLIAALQMAMRAKEERELNAWLMQQFCIHTTTPEMIAYSSVSAETLKFEQTVLNGWIKEAGISIEVRRELGKHVITMFNLREWYQSTCMRAGKSENWK
jgi:hypothetical protein